MVRVSYGLFELEAPQLIAVVETEAIRRATNIDALHTAQTWGEVRERLSPTDFSALCDIFGKDGDQALEAPDNSELVRPLDDAVFDTSYIESEHGFETWFIDPLADMVNWVPPVIRDFMGELGPGGVFCDRQLVLDSRREVWIVRELANSGFEAIRNDELVQATFEWHEGRLESILSKMGGR